MQRSVAAIAAALGMTLAVSACTDPYDPGQRAAGCLAQAPARQSVDWQAADAVQRRAR